MDKTTIAVLAAGIALAAALGYFSIYLAGIAVIITAAIVMSLLIMQDTRSVPRVDAGLRADARAVVLTNTGNAPALSIHVALVPLDIEYDVARLDADQSHEYGLPAMITSAKAALTFRDGDGREYAHTIPLSATEEFEPLRPMIPLFRWK